MQDGPHDSFDPELKKQFSRIVISLFSGMVFLVVNSILGVVLDLGFWDNPGIPGWLHIIFYLWLSFSFYLLFRFLKRLWGR
ncbi:MAG TPA: hypothetical protein VMV20_00135 [Chitinophagaceae bacterium]|nr:hypothetical protein [Chitinophagaceae bacterium]